jgi:hypothetical protein
MAGLTEWLKLMLAEIERKQDEAARAAAEQQKRQTYNSNTSSAG